jgi:tight adherence protein C
MIVLGLGACVLVFWLVCYSSGRKYAAIFEGLTEKEYPLREIYFVGYELLEKIHYQYRGKANLKLRKNVEVLYGPKYADYYLRVIHAQKVTLAFTLLILAFALYGIGNDITLLFVGFLLTYTAFYYYGMAASRKIEKRSREMMSDFSEVVSKLALMTNAGMILREAWEEIAYSGDSIIYKEMQATVDEIKNGIPEVDALYRFGSRSMSPEIKKFSSTLIQGLVKGNKELIFMLAEQSKEVWDIKKQDVSRQGEKAKSKLLIPMMIMFTGILIMLVVPIFTNLGV